MSVIPLALPWEPDKGQLSTTSLDYVMNVMPLPEGWGPISSLTPYSQALPSACKGAWWFRDDNGVFNTVAATQTGLYKLGPGTNPAWINISKPGSDTAVNGTFAADTNWTKGTNITISGGKAHFLLPPDGAKLEQAQTFTVGFTYRITFTISNYVDGAVVVNLAGGAGTVSSSQFFSNGVQTVDLIATGNTSFQFESRSFHDPPSTNPAQLDIDNVTIVGFPHYTGPADGELWTAAIFGTNFYVTNVNDPLQVISTSSMTAFANAPGSPPQAKYVATIGDFLFLAHLQTFPRKWQHSKINDPTSWVIDGGPGSSDDQEIPDGDDIVGIVPMAGANARIIQKRARRALSFTPGSFTSFSQSDIDASRGAIAPHSIVSLGSNDYFYLTENGFVMNDEYRSIGAERVDNTFLRGTPHVDPTRLFAVRATADPSRKIVWVVYEDVTGIRRVIGYNWFLDRWFQSDENASLFVAAATAGYVLDDLPLTLDEYPSPPMDSSFWMGGTFDFGAFKDDGILYVFAGDKSAATIDTTTMQLAEGTGAYVWGAELIGNLTSFTMQHGTSFLPNETLSWSAPRTRSSITGICPFSKDAKWHRFRLNITGGGRGTHVHAIRPYAKPSSIA